MKEDFGFLDKSLLEQALTHKSFLYENPHISPGHNECLEFLGDAVLDLSISHLLMKKYPYYSEGELTQYRAGLVNEKNLAKVAKTLNLHEHLKLGRREGSRERGNPRLLASVFEAFLGAFYLDRGFEITNKFIVKIFTPYITDKKNILFEEDYKTRLQERFQKLKGNLPRYVLTHETGPAHNKEFFISVYVGKEELAEGQGSSKKQAEQKAAKKALKVLLSREKEKQ